MIDMDECLEILEEIECEDEEVLQVMSDLDVDAHDARGVLRVQEIAAKASEQNERRIFLCV